MALSNTFFDCSDMLSLWVKLVRWLGLEWDVLCIPPNRHDRLPPPRLRPLFADLLRRFVKVRSAHLTKYKGFVVLY